MVLSRKSIVVLRRLLLTAALLGTALAVFVLVENQRGDRAWDRYRSGLEQKGEKLDFASFQPRSVPPAENLLKEPMLALLLYKEGQDQERRQLLNETRLLEFDGLNRYGHKNLAEVRDDLVRSGLLPGGASNTPARDILQAMQPLRPLLDAVVEAARVRPLAAFDPRPAPLEGPQLEVDAVYKVCVALGVRAAANLELGQIDSAHADVVAVQRLGNAFSEHPETLLNLLVSVAAQGLAAGAILDGSRRHHWTESHLLGFERRFNEVQPLAGMRHAMAAERAQVLYIVDLRPNLPRSGFAWPRWMFHGWAQQNKIVYCRELEARVFSRISRESDHIMIEQGSTADARTHFPPFSWVSHLALSNYDKILSGFGRSIDTLQLTAIACALERFRLARGVFPDRLQQLIPSFLAEVPLGSIDGQLPRFSTNTGVSRLYYVGPNGRDDEGGGDDHSLNEGSLSPNH